MEILISIAVIVIGLVGVVAVFPVALRDVQVSQDVSIAAQLAQSVKASLRAGFANAKYDPMQGTYTVILRHPGRRPLDQPGASPPWGGTAPPEVLDYLELPLTATEDEEPEQYPGPGNLDFYQLTYGSSEDADVTLRAFGQDALDRTGSDQDNAFEALRDPYTQYGFNLLITAIRPRYDSSEAFENLDLVGIRICRNPDLYVQIGGGGGEEEDEASVIKEEFYTIMAVR
jgi:hypothetical protein